MSERYGQSRLKTCVENKVYDAFLPDALNFYEFLELAVKTG